MPLFKPKIKNLLLNKLSQDLLWNLVSLGVMSVCGLGLNVIIGLYYDAATLGVFNQVLAIYLVTSQFAMLGMYSSVLKYVAQFSQDGRQCAAIFQAGMLLTVAVTGLITLLYWFSRGWVGQLLSPAVAEGMAWAAAGLFFNSLNKVCLAGLNGLRHMRAYAVLQAARFVFMAAGLLLIAQASWPGPSLAVVLSWAELITFALALACLRGQLRPAPWASLRPWLGRHLDFGVKSLASGVLTELNLRIDVLMLGYFTNDRLVGIYSFAAMLVEGLAQILAVLRANFDPILTQMVTQGRAQELKDFIRRAKLGSYALMGLVALVTVSGYPWLVKLLTNKPEFLESWPVFAVLMAGFWAASGYLPLRNLILAAGFPGYLSLLIAAVVAVNVTADLVLIPLLAEMGAAFGSVCSLVATVLLIRYLARRLAGVKI